MDVTQLATEAAAEHPGNPGLGEEPALAGPARIDGGHERLWAEVR